MKRIILIFTAFVLLHIQMGCGKTEQVYLEKAGQETEGFGADDGTINSSDTEEEVCYVYVCGAVEHPGVYVLKEGSRLYEAVALAGGLREDASLESVNLAEIVTDGQMVRIWTKEEAASSLTSELNGENSKVNLNTATVSELMTLPGIGESKANSIIAYREAQGAFLDVAELMNVDGIKEGVYNRLKDFVRVK